MTIQNMLEGGIVRIKTAVVLESCLALEAVPHVAMAIDRTSRAPHIDTMVIPNVFCQFGSTAKYYITSKALVDVSHVVLLQFALLQFLLFKAMRTLLVETRLCSRPGRMF
jgi:hypothetical protein